MAAQFQVSPFWAARNVNGLAKACLSRRQIADAHEQLRRAFFEAVKSYRLYVSKINPVLGSVLIELPPRPLVGFRKLARSGRRLGQASGSRVPSERDGSVARQLKNGGGSSDIERCTYPGFLRKCYPANDAEDKTTTRTPLRRCQRL